MCVCLFFYINKLLKMFDYCIPVAALKNNNKWPNKPLFMLTFVGKRTFISLRLTILATRRQYNKVQTSDLFS